MFFHKEVVINLASKFDTVYILDGSVSPKKRQVLIKEFNEKEKGILFLNYRSCGKGLDIKGVDHVIFVEKTWGSKSDYQAYMRCYGFKRTKNLNIFSLEYKDEHKRAVTSKKMVFDRM